MKEDTQHKVGKIFEVAERDAIHIAVLPARAQSRLYRGTPVGYVNGVATTDGEPVGIVDPFLEDIVEEGQRFFIFLYPNTITTLRHQWVHPRIPDTVTEEDAFGYTKKESEEWLRNWVETADCPDFDTVIAVATGASTADGYLENSYDGEPYLFFGGQDAHGEIPPEFWRHLENMTGKKVPQESRAVGFSCSC